ncbi:MAG: hypothetical protein ABI574_04805 [Burkholderiales bacterium]
MINEWDRLLGAVVQSLRAQVAPHLANETAGVQLNAAIYILNNLRLQGGWSNALQHSQVAAQQQLFATLRTTGLGPEVEPPSAAVSTDPLAQRKRADEAIVALIDQLASVPAARRDPAFETAHRALMAYLRESVALDCAATARSMMKEMSGSGSESLIDDPA